MKQNKPKPIPKEKANTETYYCIKHARILFSDLCNPVKGQKLQPCSFTEIYGSEILFWHYFTHCILQKSTKKLLKGRT